MKVTRNTPDHLIIGHQPWIMGLVFIAVILMFIYFGLDMALEGDRTGYLVALLGGGFGFVFFGAFIRRTQAIFDRRANLFTLRSRTILGYKQKQWPLTDVERAIIETSSDSDGDTHRPTILMCGGADRRIPLTPVYESGVRAERMRDAINDWLVMLDSGAMSP